MKISVITPSVRPEFLPIIEKCLGRQTFIEYEWLVVSPKNYGFGGFIQEPPKREGDYYNLNKAWNEAFKHANSDLIVSIVDGLWFEPDLLERLWYHYEDNPKAIVGAVGHQYDQLINGKPEHMVWRDPRARNDLGSFYVVPPTEIEWCIASFPKKAIYDVGGMDEEWDKFAALSEKETNVRMEKVGYQCYLDQLIEYRAIHHPRLSEEWDKKYQEGCKFYQKCILEIIEGKRLKLNYDLIGG